MKRCEKHDAQRYKVIFLFFATSLPFTFLVQFFGCKKDTSSLGDAISEAGPCFSSLAEVLFQRTLADQCSKVRQAEDVLFEFHEFHHVKLQAVQ